METLIKGRLHGKGRMGLPIVLSHEFPSAPAMENKSEEYIELQDGKQT